MYQIQIQTGNNENIGMERLMLQFNLDFNVLFTSIRMWNSFLTSVTIFPFSAHLCSLVYRTMSNAQHFVAINHFPRNPALPNLVLLFSLLPWNPIELSSQYVWRLMNMSSHYYTGRVLINLYIFTDDSHRPFFSWILLTICFVIFSLSN